jgi:hypothetical protein
MSAAPLPLVPINPPPRVLPSVTADSAAPSVNPEQSAPPMSPLANKPTEPVAPAPVPPADVAPMPKAVAPVPTPAPVASTPTPAPVHAMPEPSAASPQYYNSPDYSILFGVLDYNARHGTWRLRYADAGEEDRYGGVVTLDGIGRQMDGFSSGQFVRVEGGLVDPDSHAVSPAYRVKDMRPGTDKR